MKKFFTAIAAIAVMAMFTSCEQDAPEINFSQTDTHMSNFSGIIEALNSQTLSLAAKLQLINDAIDDLTFSFEDKMEILNAAVEFGILTYIEQSEYLITAIDNQTTDLSAKLVLIEKAITTQTLSLETKLQLLTDAVEAGFLSGIAAINTLTNSANGIYRLSSEQSALYMQPAVWEAIKGNPVLEAAILSSLWDVNITQIIPADHDQGHAIAYIEPMPAPTFDLAWEWNSSAIPGGANQELVKVYKTLSSTSPVTNATYHLYKALRCDLGFGKVNITDARGEFEYDFGGIHNDNTINWGPAYFVAVDVYFEHNGNTVTSATVIANMIQ